MAGQANTFRAEKVFSRDRRQRHSAVRRTFAIDFLAGVRWRTCDRLVPPCKLDGPFTKDPVAFSSVMVARIACKSGAGRVHQDSYVRMTLTETVS